MTIYEIDREATGKETEARIQKDGSLGLHFSLISGRKQENGFRFFRRVWYSAKANSLERLIYITTKPFPMQPFFDKIQNFLGEIPHIIADFGVQFQFFK